MKRIYHIQIAQYRNTPNETELFLILEQLLPIKCILGGEIEIGVDGAILVGDRSNKSRPRSPSLSIPLLASTVNESLQINTEVKFADDPDVPFPFRGRSIDTKFAQFVPFLSVQPNEKVLASSKGGPIWLIGDIGGVKHFKSALPLPTISLTQNFSDVFHGGCFMEMLILLQFIREISKKTAFQNAPLRAGFIIDDPNLHWPRYGFVDYKELVIHGRKENYHTAIATIPFDTWFTHTKTAELFRTNSRWLSLLTHGNNHAKEELAQNYSAARRKSLLQQANHRINRLEQKANLHVCHVMVPPHGACSEEMLAELPKYGFESACISTGSLRAHNKDKTWTKTLGFFPAEFIQGCSVFPRWGLDGNVKNSLLLAAYLGQPMILRGHHLDLKEGVEIFDEYARFINSLGNVIWSNMTSLSRLNYQWRMEGAIYVVKPFGNKISFKLPHEANSVVIENHSSMDGCVWQAVSADGCERKTLADNSLLLLAAMGSEILIEHKVISQFNSVSADLRPTSAALILRRILAETRDRLLVS